MKRVVSILLCISLLLVGMTVFSPTAEAAEHTVVVKYTGKNQTVASTSVIIYPNKGTSPWVIVPETYGFRYANLMIFNKNGLLIEAGGQLYSNSSTVTGSAQTSVTVPAGGFMVAFGGSASSALRNCYDIAFEGAVLYNATMSIVYEMHGSYNESTSEITIKYPDPRPVTANTKKYLFVGNSSTYFNGTPLKFKALCFAAGLDVSVDYCTFGSATLTEFSNPNHDRGKALRNALTSKKYDYVVLQDRSAATYLEIEGCLKVLLPLIYESGATPLLYMRYGNGDNNKNHYLNYATLGAKYDLTVAPSALAYYRCINQYPSIELFASDGGHHSRDGSYLIACTWLYAFTGVSPVGNTYTAEIPASTVSALQNVAKNACEVELEGYEFPKKTVTESGVTYQSIAEGKKYTVSGGVYKGVWTDTDANGNPIGKYTDGKFAADGEHSIVGCYSGSNVVVTIDLGATCQFKELLTDLYGRSDWGIGSPSNATVKVAVSTDGVKFTDLGTAVSTYSPVPDAWERRYFTLKTTSLVNARYIRTSYTIEKNFCWTSEIRVFGETIALPWETKANTTLHNDLTNNKLANLRERTTASSFLNEFVSDVRVFDKNGTQLSGSNLLGTGNTIKCYDKNGNVIGTAVVSVKGDVTGDGYVNVTDYLLIKRHVQRLSVLEGVYFRAALTSGSSDITVTDYIRIKRYFQNLYDLYT